MNMAISKPFRFEIGQQVMVCPDFTRDDARGAGYVDDMENYRGKIVTIKSRFNYDYEGYNIREDSGKWSWSAKQFQPIHINEDELIAQLITGIITPDTYNTLLKYKEGGHS